MADPIMSGDSDSRIEIDFRAGGNSADYTLNGWGNPEPHGSWTVGPESRLRLRGFAANTRYQLTANVGPFVDPPRLPYQDLSVEVAGAEVWSHRFTAGGKVDCVIPAHAIGAGGTVEIMFRCPNAKPPKELGPSEDDRPLAFTFFDLTLTRAIAGAFGGTSPKLAAVTMVYNEPEHLPIWLRHYSRHVGAENCYVIDHGSDDGSTASLAKANVIRIPRSPYDPILQSTFTSRFCASLLCWYDRVLYCDADEILLPDPKIAPTLVEYCQRPLPDVLNAIGLNMLHLSELEADFDPSKLVTQQRSWVFASSSMCKPLLISRPVVWPGGSHSADAPVRFDHLYLFHLRWYDLKAGLRKIAKTRAMPWAHHMSAGHQRIADNSMLQQFTNFAALKRMEDVDFDPGLPPIKEFLDKILISQVGREQHPYTFDINIWGQNLWKIPNRFVGTF
jgi:hypothetical protein